MKVKAKVCFFGEGGVGKTSLIKRFVLNQFSDDYLTTIGTKISKKNITRKHPEKDTNVDVVLIVWDIMGQKGFRDLLKEAYFYGAQGAIGVFDMTKEETLKEIPGWIDTLFDVTGKVPVILLANKADLESEWEVGKDDVKAMADKYDIPYFFTSAKTGEMVGHAFGKMGDIALSYMWESRKSE